MIIGGLRNRVRLEQRSQVADNSVGITEGFAEIAEVWGSVYATRGAVYLGSMQVGETITHRIVLRWTDPTAFTHLSTDGGTRRFRKRDARDPDGRRRWLEVMAEELSSDYAA